MVYNNKANKIIGVENEKKNIGDFYICVIDIKY